MTPDVFWRVENFAAMLSAVVAASGSAPGSLPLGEGPVAPSQGESMGALAIGERAARSFPSSGLAAGIAPIKPAFTRLSLRGRDWKKGLERCEERNERVYVTAWDEKGEVGGCVGIRVLSPTRQLLQQKYLCKLIGLKVN